MEEVKRLHPTPSTKRNLFLKSGNYCALCKQILLLEDGAYIGKICHIESAEEFGPRFNAESTNEERRKEENLIILCSNCHEKIDGATKGDYSVARLKELKKDHEALFYNEIARIIDPSINQSYVTPKNLNKFNRVTGAPEEYLNGPEYKKDIERFSNYIVALAKLPPRTRDVLAIIVGRCSSSYGTLISEILETVPEDDLTRNIEILVHNKFIKEPDDGYFHLCSFGFDFPFEDAIQEFLGNDKTKIANLYHDLDFSDFDE